MLRQRGGLGSTCFRIRCSCLTQLALTKQDKSYCYHLEDASTCLEAIALATEDSSFCDYSAFCVSAVALKKNEPSLCGTLPPTLEGNCLHLYAGEINDPAYCPVGDDYCLEQFS